MGYWLWLIGLAACSFAPQTAAQQPGDGSAPTAIDAAIDARAIDAGPIDGSGSGTVPGIAFVKEVVAQFADTNHASISVAVPSQQVGDSNVVAISWYNAQDAGFQSLADTNHNTYASIDEVDDRTIAQQVFLATNIAAGSDTVTVSFDSQAKFIEIRVLEYAGLSSTIDETKHATGSGNTEATGSLTTAHGNDLLVGSFTGDTTGSAGTSYTTRIKFEGDLEEDRIVTAAGTYAATAPANGGAYVASLVAIEGAR